MTISFNIWMLCLELNWFCYDPSRMLQLSEFVRNLRSSVWDVLNNFHIIDATDRRKICGDQKRFFIALSLYPLSFLKWIFLINPIEAYKTFLSPPPPTSLPPLFFLLLHIFVFLIHIISLLPFKSVTISSPVPAPPLLSKPTPAACPTPSCVIW